MLLSGVWIPFPRLEPVPVETAAAPVRLAPRNGRIALTFDDGPDPTWTPVVLDILDRYGVRATFFVNGFRVDRHPEIAAEIVRRGHSLQNHGYGHRRLTEATDAGVRWDVDRGARSILSATGVLPTCLRPPWGATSGRVRRVVESLDHEVVLWTLDSRDYAGVPGSTFAATVLERLRPGDIVLMHDTIGWAARDALPVIIEQARARGLEFETICGHLGPATGGERLFSGNDGRPGRG